MKKQSNPITPDKVEEIKVLLQSNKYFQHQIAAIVGVNQGRISEVKNGQYG